MKNHLLKISPIGFLVTLLLFVGSVQAQSKIADLCSKLSENKKMTIVNISKDMMTMINGDEEGMKKLVKTIEGMRIISSEKLTPEEQADIDKLVTPILNEGYKELMNISDKGEGTDVRICIKPLGEDQISEFVIYVREGKELSLISITGKIPKAKIMELTQLAKIKDMGIGDMVR